MAEFNKKIEKKAPAVNDIELDSFETIGKSFLRPKFEFQEPIFFDDIFPDIPDTESFDTPILLDFKQKENFFDNQVGFRYLRYRHYTRQILQNLCYQTEETGSNQESILDEASFTSPVSEKTNKNLKLLMSNIGINSIA